MSLIGTRKWDDVYMDMDTISAEERDEIALNVKAASEALAASKAYGMTQADMEDTSATQKMQ